MEKFKAKLLKFLKLDKQISGVASLLNKNIDYFNRVKKTQVYIIAVIFIITYFLGGYFETFISIVWLIGVLLITLNVYVFKTIKPLVKEKYELRDRLLYFIKSNNLFVEESEEYEERDKRTGNYKTKKRKIITRSALFSYDYNISKNRIIISAYKKGDSFSKKMNDLDVELSALLNLPIYEKIEYPNRVVYLFRTVPPTRLKVRSTGRKEVSNDISINLGYGVIYNPVKTPHALIAGGTGSGKSMFISFLLIELLKRNSTVYICDPKNSDLGSLSHYLGDERVATSPNNIARVLRLAVEEMKSRYTYMNENFIYGSNFVTHGYNQIWVVFDEMGAFQATGTDKKSKEVINEVMDYIKQIILLGRQAGVFVLVSSQQMSANVLSTELRDNLGLRISLGSNSSEGYRMVFGSNTPDTIPPVETKGAGLLYMQGSGKESAQYWEAPFIDLKNYDFIEELKRYV